MAWTKVLAAAELPPGGRQVVQVEGHKVLLLNQNGQIHAVDNTCPHLKLSMKKGKVTEEGTIVCPWHRSAFDLCTGEAKEWTPWPPGVGKVMGMLSTTKNLPVFATRLEDGNIWVEV